MNVDTNILETMIEKRNKEFSIKLRNFENLKPLFEKLGEKKYVLLGEASHGTHEYYTWRAAISKELIRNYDFSFVAVEGDWPDCYRVNRYVKGYPDSGISAFEVLYAFNRWPTWMWANQEVVEFVEWLKEHNKDLSDNEKVGFYGLDVYSLWDSLQAIIQFLKKKDPEAIKIAINAYRCFEPYSEVPQEYARALMFVPSSCENEVITLLKTIQERQPIYKNDHEEIFS